MVDAKSKNNIAIYFYIKFFAFSCLVFVFCAIWVYLRFFDKNILQNIRESLPFMAVVSLAYSASLLGCLLIPIRGLRLEHATSVNALFYFLSVSAIFSFIAVFVGVKLQAIGADGKAKNIFGQLFFDCLTFLTQIDDDILISVLAIVVVIGPQLLAYILSGAFGCASKIIFVGEVIAFSFWFSVKPLIVSAGILCGVAFSSLYCGLTWITTQSLLETIFLSSILVFLTFWSVYAYEGAKKPISGKSSDIPNWLKRAIVETHNYATKYNAATPGVGLLSALSKYFSPEVTVARKGFNKAAGGCGPNCAKTFAARERYWNRRFFKSRSALGGRGSYRAKP